MSYSISEKDRSWPAIEHFLPHYFINFIWAVLAFYLFYFYFIRFFEKKRFVLYLLFSILISFSITFFFMPLHQLLLPGFNVFTFRLCGPPVAGTFILIQCGSLVRGFENWLTNVQIRTELENRNLRNELEFLKSQVNPHFLFNTLNNIDALIHSAPDRASASLITLSELMRYMIYETGQETVSLEKEIQYLKNYIGLQRLRFGKKNYIRFTAPDHCEHIMVAPMLFIPFVENAFKFSQYIGISPVIDISLICSGKDLVFTCINHFDPRKNPEIKKGGVGISNVQRRLEILYKNRHELQIQKENSIFKVSLVIHQE